MALIIQARLLQHPDCGLANVGYRVRYLDANRIQRFDLIIGRALAAADDGARMAHPFARRRLTAGDETDNRFLHVGLDPLRRFFFRRAADLTDHDYG